MILKKDIGRAIFLDRFCLYKTRSEVLVHHKRIESNRIGTRDYINGRLEKQAKECLEMAHTAILTTVK